MTLDAWHALGPHDTRTIVVVGDSHSDDTAHIGGFHTWAEEIIDLMRWRTASQHLGYRPPGKQSPETAFAGTWTKDTTTDAWDKTPYGYGRYQSGGSANIVTWTPPSGTTVDYFDVHCVDKAGSTNMSYSVDSGAWVDLAMTLTQGNAIRTQRIYESVATNVRIRGRNAADSANRAGHYAGISAYANAPSRTIIHNLAKASEFLATFARSTSGDGFAFLDLLAPDLIVVMHVSDSVNRTGAQYATDLQAVIDHAGGIGADVLCVVAPEVGIFDTADQEEIADATRSTAATNGCGLVDVKEAWVDFATADAAGFFQADDAHLTEAGALDAAHRVLSALASDGAGPRVRLAA